MMEQFEEISINLSCAADSLDALVGAFNNSELPVTDILSAVQWIAGCIRAEHHRMDTVITKLSRKGDNRYEGEKFS